MPELAETIWFVSGPEEAASLQAEGVQRGRIWTASELRTLLHAPGITQEDALAIARTKITFGGEAIESRPDAESSTVAPAGLDDPPEPTQRSLGLEVSPARESD